MNGTDFLRKVKSKKDINGTDFLRKMEAGDSTVWDDLMPMVKDIVGGVFNDFNINDDHLKKDVMQDVATRVITKWQSYSRESALSTWLYSIARNRCFDEMRKRKVRGDGPNRKANPPDDSSASSPHEPSYEDKPELILGVQSASSPHEPSYEDKPELMLCVQSASSPHEPSYEDKPELMLCMQQIMNELNAEGPARRGSHRIIDVLIHMVKHSSTTEELAIYLNTSDKAAKQRKHTIRKRFEELYKKFCGDEVYCRHITGGAS